MKALTAPKYVSYHMWTDVVAYEVIDHPSPQTIRVRRLKQDVSLKNCDFIRGGFFGHVPNPSAQEWTFASDPDAKVEKLRWSKKYGTFGGRNWSHEDEPYAYYDPNF